MRYLSVCSGIEAASVAWHPLGWQALAFSEIEPFPRALLQHHFPDVPLYGDFTVLRDEPWIVDADLLVGGTPCQAFSVAGLRNSLSDDRGNLSLEFVRLANAIDDLRFDAGKHHAWICWENVPGVLNTKDNAFGAFLGGLAGSDAPIPSPPDTGWPCAGVVAGPRRVCAWRVLDAQFFGVAQRRRRVFVLALGGAGGWACADALLPVGHSLQGHSAPCREAGKDTAPTLAARTRGGGGLGTDFECDGGLIPQYAGNAEDAPFLTASNLGKCVNNQTPLVTHTLRGEGHDASEDGTGRGIPLVTVFDPNQITSATNRSVPTPELCHTLPATENAPVCFEVGNLRRRCGAEPNEHVVPTLGADKLGDCFPHIAHHAQVRRLTPRECERLQGFPDDYTLIPMPKVNRHGTATRSPLAADSPRYKAIGNSMCVNVMFWIGERIQAVEEILQASATA